MRKFTFFIIWGVLAAIQAVFVPWDYTVIFLVSATLIYWLAKVGTDNNGYIGYYGSVTIGRAILVVIFSFIPIFNIVLAAITLSVFIVYISERFKTFFNKPL